ncbi:GTP-binding protein [Egibacter rhizosphaerae]|uniref:sulfate adenylyltransferase n=2 Tax=Egibacter rhizosphaerae TaxID=1670831 RepID=A0A411YLH8_9ACTN|nr:GTP-binding protein [Egibacter rhizosphaerae]
MDLLRFTTAGSVDDGKSTLIGRLLYDSKQVFADQLEQVEAASAALGDDGVNLALLTDGLRAEREQGITIDVAYRYFATPRRKFIIADTPGHEQYTRNMVTGASTSNLAVVLVDAQQGMTQQSRRHASIASLLGIPHVVVAVNKMDLVGYREDAFERIVHDFTAFAAKLETTDVTFIPISALHGDNVVTRSDAMPWYQGPSLLYHLETVHIASDRNLVDTRFPVQRVTRRRNPEYRGYAGTMAAGILRPGEDVVVLPSGFESTVEAIDTLEGEVDEAFPPMAVTVRLADDLDVGRGDMLARPRNRPEVTQELDAMVCWMSDRPLAARGMYALKHTTRDARAMITDVVYRLDVDTLHRDPEADRLAANDLGRVRLRTTTPLCVDPYDRNRSTGSFVLVDEQTDSTVGAGMILDRG